MGEHHLGPSSPPLALPCALVPWLSGRRSYEHFGLPGTLSGPLGAFQWKYCHPLVTFCGNDDVMPYLWHFSIEMCVIWIYRHFEVTGSARSPDRPDKGMSALVLNKESNNCITHSPTHSISPSRKLISYYCKWCHRENKEFNKESNIFRYTCIPLGC